jgi:putative N-acetyltransferase (TIGR04045 family)
LVPVCALARGPAQRAAHFAIRRSVFVEAQALFDLDDRDERDDDPATLHVVGLAGEDVVGAVRLYPLDRDGLWKGDRLAVLPAERALRLGAMLVRFAVRTAGELGGRRMVAQIQVPNVRFFERLGWRRDGDPAPMLGVEHQPMTIELSGGWT